MIPLAPLLPIQRIGYLSGHIVCTKNTGPFLAGGLYPVQTLVWPAHSSANWADALGRSVKLSMRSLETIVFVGGVKCAFAPAHVRPNISKPAIGDYATLLEHFDIPEVPDLGALNPQAMRLAGERVRQLERLIAGRVAGFSYFPHQSEDLARTMRTNGVRLASMTGLGKALGLLSWPLLKLGWMADAFLYPNEPALILCPDELVGQLEAESMRLFGVAPYICTRFDEVTEPGLYLAGYHRLARK